MKGGAFVKKIRFYTLALGLAFLLTGTASASEEPSVSAQSAIVTDAESGRVLYGKDIDDRMLIASTTKIMTALIALECLEPEQTVEIDPSWTGIEGSSMYLRAGQKLTVRELLTGLLLASGNDAAVALACAAEGSEAHFAEKMNARAVEIGCTNTHFENASGLDGDTHYSSARDLALITREALQNEEFRRIVSTESAVIDGRTYTNHNRLLRECEGVFGVKTGYTMAAGRTLVTCCERGGHTLICVTLSDPDDWTDHKTLYDWAFETHSAYLVPDDYPLCEIPVIGGEADRVAVYASEPAEIFMRDGERVRLSFEMPPFVYAPVHDGDKIGTATIWVEDTPVGSVSVRFGEDVCRTEEQSGFWQKITDIFGKGERKIYTLS